MFNIYWPYKSILSISDILIFLTQYFQKKNIPFTISDDLDPISHNIVIENLNDETTNKIILFCKKYNTKISLYVSEYVQFSKKNGDLYPAYKDDYYIENITNRFKNILRIKKYISSLISIMLDDNSLESYKDYLQNSNFFNFVPDSNFRLKLNNKNYEYDTFFYGTVNTYRKNELINLKKKYRVKAVDYFLTNELRSYYLKKSKTVLHINVDKYNKYSSPLRVYFAALNGKYTISDKSCIFTKEFIIDISNLENKMLNNKPRFDREKKNEFKSFILFIKNNYL